MLDPSDSKQRSTLVEIVWLLVALYVLYSICGLGPSGCQQAPPPAAKQNAVRFEHTLNPMHESGLKRKPLVPEDRKKFP